MPINFWYFLTIVWVTYKEPYITFSNVLLKFLETIREKFFNTFSNIYLEKEFKMSMNNSKMFKNCATSSNFHYKCLMHILISNIFTIILIWIITKTYIYFGENRCFENFVFFFKFFISFSNVIFLLKYTSKNNISKGQSTFY